MLGRLNHVAIVVPDLSKAADHWRNTFGAKVSEPLELPEHGVRVVFIDLPNTRIELLAALGDDSPVSQFVESHVAGGLHHLCFEVNDIQAARDQLVQQGTRILGDGQPRIGAHGKPVLFLHPKDMNGCLLELQQS